MPARSRSRRAPSSASAPTRRRCSPRSGWPLVARARRRRRALLRGRLAARLSGAARAAPLPRLRDARLLDARLSSCSATRNGSPAASTASATCRARACSARRPTGRGDFYLSSASPMLAARSRSPTWWLIRSPWGRAFVALRENPIRALSLGVDTRRYTLMAFAIGSALGGVAGVLYAPLVAVHRPDAVHAALSLNLLLMVIVGGSGYFFGPFLGARRSPCCCPNGCASREGLLPHRLRARSSSLLLRLLARRAPRPRRWLAAPTARPGPPRAAPRRGRADAERSPR